MAGNGNRRSSDRQQELDEILAELMRAIDADESIDSDEWIRRHPEFEAELRNFFAQQQRLDQLLCPLRQAAAKALNVRCPHCHNPIELLDEAFLAEISCPSCGSSFSLMVDKTVSHYQPGEKTVGHFQLLDRVGVGQFGSVWKARDTQLDRTVAVKLPRNTQLDGTQAELFLRDARAAAQLKHPNIVSVHEVGKQDETVYIVSDFIHGATLKEWMTTKRLTPREIAELCVKIAKALHHAHDAGVIHRDLKPGNIMMDADGEPHLVDFGLAKREAGEITMTVEGQILGTPAYMSPEQARGDAHQVDRRTDIYSLGVILFELLTGELPFRGDKQMLMVQILHDDPPSPRKLDASVPRDLDTVCLKCMKKDAAKRYSTAQHVADDLCRWLSGESIVARPPSAIERVSRSVKRRPAAAALIVMSTLALLFCVGMVVNFWNRSRVEAINQRLQQTNAQLGAAVTAKNESNAKLAQAVKNANEARQTADLSRRRADRYFYISQIQLADIALSEGHRRNAWAALERFIPRSVDDQDVRGIEWYYQWHRCGGQRLTLRGDGSDIIGLTYAPQGNLLATASADGSMTVWDAFSGKRVSRFDIGRNKCVHLAFASDGKSVYCLQDNGVICHWGLNGRRRSDFDAAASNVVAGMIAGRNEVAVTQATRFNHPRVHRLSLQQEGAGIELSRSTNEPGGRSFGIARPTTDESAVKEEVVFSLNRAGTLLAVGTSHPDSNVLLHDVSPEADSITLTFHAPVGCIAISDDGRYVAIGEGTSQRLVRHKGKDRFRISIWNTQTKSLVAELTNTSPFTHSVFSPDGTQLAMAGKDQMARMWDLASVTSSRAGRDAASRTIQASELQELTTFYSQSEIRQLEFSPTGERLAVSDDSGIVRVWNTRNDSKQTTSLVRSHSVYPGKRIGEVSFLAQGNDVLVRGLASLRVIDAISGNQRAEIGDLQGSDQYGGRLGISPDYKLVADGKHVVNLSAASVVRELHEAPPELLDVTFDSTGEYLAIARPYAEATLYEVRTGEVLHHFTTPRWCTAVTFGTNATLISGTGWMPFEARPNQVDIWSLQTGQHLRTLDRAKHSVWRLRLSPDGTKLAAATGNYGHPYLNEILIWDFATGELLHSLRGHKECVFDVDFSPDGMRLASVAGDWRVSPNGELFVWDVMTGERVLSLVTEDGGLLCVDFDDTGHQIVAGSARGSIVVLRGPK